MNRINSLASRIALVGLVTTLAASSSLAEGLLGQGWRKLMERAQAPTDVWAVEGLDLDQDLPSFGNFRIKEDARQGGNGFGMAYRTQEHLHASHKNEFMTEGSYLDADLPLGAHAPKDQMLAYQHDTSRVRSESRVLENQGASVSTDLLRWLTTSQLRNLVFSISSSADKRTRYLTVLRGQKLLTVYNQGKATTHTRVFDFYDPHVSWNGLDGAPTRTGTLLVLGEQVFVEKAWADAASADRTNRIGDSFGVDGDIEFFASWSGEDGDSEHRTFVRLPTDRLGTAVIGEEAASAGYDWKKLRDGGPRTPAFGSSIRNGVQTIIENTPVSDTVGALEAINSGGDIEFASFDETVDLEVNDIQ